MHLAGRPARYRFRFAPHPFRTSSCVYSIKICYSVSLRGSAGPVDWFRSRSPCPVLASLAYSFPSTRRRNFLSPNAKAISFNQHLQWRSEECNDHVTARPYSGHYRTFGTRIPSPLKPCPPPPRGSRQTTLVSASLGATHSQIPRRALRFARREPSGPRSSPARCGQEEGWRGFRIR